MPIGGKWTRGHQVDLAAAAGKEGDNGGRIYIEKLEAYATAKGAVIECNALVTALLLDDAGTVVGCEVTRADGNPVAHLYAAGEAFTATTALAGTRSPTS